MKKHRPIQWTLLSSRATCVTQPEYPVRKVFSLTLPYLLVMAASLPAAA